MAHQQQGQHQQQHQQQRSKIECVCDKSRECGGVSGLFRLCLDVRGGWVELPDVGDPRRASYLKHLRPSISSYDPLLLSDDGGDPNGDGDDSGRRHCYVAGHHFDPTVLARDFHGMCLRKNAANTGRRDHVLRVVGKENGDGGGLLANDASVVPDYPLDAAKNDAREAYANWKKRQAFVVRMMQGGGGGGGEGAAKTPGTKSATTPGDREGGGGAGAGASDNNNNATKTPVTAQNKSGKVVPDTDVSAITTSTLPQHIVVPKAEWVLEKAAHAHALQKQHSHPPVKANANANANTNTNHAAAGNGSGPNATTSVTRTGRSGSSGGSSEALAGVVSTPPRGGGGQQEHDGHRELYCTDSQEEECHLLLNNTTISTLSSSSPSPPHKGKRSSSSSSPSPRKQPQQPSSVVEIFSDDSHDEESEAGDADFAVAGAMAAVGAAGAATAAGRVSPETRPTPVLQLSPKERAVSTNLSSAGADSGRYRSPPGKVSRATAGAFGGLMMKPSPMSPSPSSPLATGIAGIVASPRARDSKSASSPVGGGAAAPAASAAWQERLNAARAGSGMNKRGRSSLDGPIDLDEVMGSDTDTSDDGIYRGGPVDLDDVSIDDTSDDDYSERVGDRIFSSGPVDLDDSISDTSLGEEIQRPETGNVKPASIFRPRGSSNAINQQQRKEAEAVARMDSNPLDLSTEGFSTSIPPQQQQSGKHLAFDDSDEYSMEWRLGASSSSMDMATMLNAQAKKQDEPGIQSTESAPTPVADEVAASEHRRDLDDISIDVSGNMTDESSEDMSLYTDEDSYGMPDEDFDHDDKGSFEVTANQGNQGESSSTPTKQRNVQRQQPLEKKMNNSEGSMSLDFMASADLAAMQASESSVGAEPEIVEELQKEQLESSVPKQTTSGFASSGSLSIDLTGHSTPGEVDEESPAEGSFDILPNEPEPVQEAAVASLQQSTGSASIDPFGDYIHDEHGSAPLSDSVQREVAVASLQRSTGSTSIDPPGEFTHDEHGSAPLSDSVSREVQSSSSQQHPQQQVSKETNASEGSLSIDFMASSDEQNQCEDTSSSLDKVADQLPSRQLPQDSHVSSGSLSIDAVTSSSIDDAPDPTEEKKETSSTGSLSIGLGATDEDESSDSPAAATTTLPLEASSGSLSIGLGADGADKDPEDVKKVSVPLPKYKAQEASSGSLFIGLGAADSVEPIEGSSTDNGKNEASSGSLSIGLRNNDNAEAHEGPVAKDEKHATSAGSLSIGLGSEGNTEAPGAPAIEDEKHEASAGSLSIGLGSEHIDRPSEVAELKSSPSLDRVGKSEYHHSSEVKVVEVQNEMKNSVGENGKEKEKEELSLRFEDDPVLMASHGSDRSGFNKNTESGILIEGSKIAPSEGDEKEASIRMNVSNGDEGNKSGRSRGPVDIDSFHYESLELSESSLQPEDEPYRQQEDGDDNDSLTDFVIGGNDPLSEDQQKSALLTGEPRFKERKRSSLFALSIPNDAVSLGASLCGASLGAIDEKDDFDEEYEPTDEFGNLKPLAKVKCEDINTLSEIESKRRNWFMQELDMLSLEWVCYRDITVVILNETNEVESSLQKSTKSAELYADMLKAIRGDTFLDNSDQIVSSSTLSSQLATQRYGTIGDGLNQGVSPPLKSVLDLFNVTVDKIGDGINLLEKEVEAMKELRKEITSRASGLQKSGDNHMHELEMAESRVQIEWANLEEACTGQGLDRWLAETSYKNTAERAMCSFRIRCSELQNIGVEVIKLDAMRRRRTKEILLSFLPRRRRLFLKTVEGFDSTVSSLQGEKDRRLERKRVEGELDLALEKLSPRNTKDSKSKRPPVTSRTLKTLDLLFSPSAEVNNLQAKSPFESLHVKELKAVEVKSGAKSSWRLALSVITEDRHMHVMLCSLRKGDIQGEDFRKKPERLMASKLTGSVPNLSFALATTTASLPPTGENLIEFALQGDSRKLSMRLSSLKGTTDWYDNHKRLFLNGIAVLEKDEEEEEEEDEDDSDGSEGGVVDF